jgi:phosphoribosylaminoimidazole-succinocarboxamide synthase
VSTVGQNKLVLSYEGSVKRVFQCPWQAGSLLFQFTDDYSIFDWGKMPDTIENKGKALVLYGAFLFERLAQASFWNELPGALADGALPLCPEFLRGFLDSKMLKSLRKDGLASHFQGLVDAEGRRLGIKQAAALQHDVYMQVCKAVVQEPEDFTVLNQSIFHYPRADTSVSTRLVPLEVVFRFGMPLGSSLTSRLKRDPSYAKVLGLKSVPQEGEMFDRPVLEFFTKLEPKDRLLTLQEALLISGLSKEQFSDLVERAQLIALACFYIFSRSGIELWDGKFEFVLHNGALLLADSIGPDELRLLYRGTQLSKEMIRQVYRGSGWEKALKEAQALAREQGRSDWKAICKNELNCQPQPLKEDLKAVLNKLYGVMANDLSGELLFVNHPCLEEFVKAVKAGGL